MRKLLVIIATVMGIAVCNIASAAPILLNPDFGRVILPASETDEYAVLLAAIAAYNETHDLDLPEAGDIDLTPQLVGDATSSGTGHAILPGPTPTSITIDFGLEPVMYVLLTWDGPNGGTLIYYVGGETGPVTFHSPFFPNQDPTQPSRQYGLSHYMFTGSVPDGGTTLALLGLALAALGVARRHMA